MQGKTAADLAEFADCIRGFAAHQRIMAL